MAREIVYHEESGRLAVKVINYEQVELSELRDEEEKAMHLLDAAKMLQSAGYEGMEEVVRKAEAHYNDCKSELEMGENLAREHDVQPGAEATGGPDQDSASEAASEPSPDFAQLA